jgi:hypothetical protein
LDNTGIAMGNAAGKEFNEKEIAQEVVLHPDGKNAFSTVVVTTTALTLTGKTVFGAKPGYSYSDAEKKVFFQTQAEGSLGRKGEILDGDKNVVATVRIVSAWLVNKNRKQALSGFSPTFFT